VGAVVFAMLLLTAALIGLSSSGSATIERTLVQASYAGVASYTAACHQLVLHAAVTELGENYGGCEAPVSCPPTGSACCGTTCHAAADQVEVPYPYPPAAEARGVGSTMRLQVEAVRPGMFRPPIG
jgi:hypothetical protein